MRVIPSGRPESSFVAKLPSVATTFGRISSIWRNRWPSQAAVSSGSGARWAGGPDERDALLVLVEAGRLADEHHIGVRVARAEDDLRPAPAERAANALG